MRVLPPDPVVELSDVTFGYGREIVLDRVSLTLGQDEFLAIVGPNGGGKTTLLKVVLGLLRPWSGSVQVRLERRRGALGYVPQFASFDRSFPLKVREVVGTGRLGISTSVGPYRSRDHRAVAAVLERLGLQEVATAPIGDLSGGELQRTLIARALVSQPEILLMDEPLAAIDVESRRLVVEALVEHNRKIPVVVVTHHLGFLAGAVKRQVRMNRRLTETPVGDAAPNPAHTAAL